ncbi:DUF736 domain-containing protein [Henriciella aquimarina]|uniref:DUF736 domain-containing protein n=1 Tax=Henriciella aquimarina TaxID=545261 RepID=UPI0009FEBD18|nr:DUF736 domain-containing protein [Henriciella aquimarina]
MAQIGSFTFKDGKYTGTIRTMTINVKAQLVPNKDKGNNGGPEFRLYAGGAELGAAWREESKDGETPYLSVKLDDPGFAAPMRAAFFENEKDGTGVMMWKRPKTSAA